MLQPIVSYANASSLTKDLRNGFPISWNRYSRSEDQRWAEVAMSKSGCLQSRSQRTKVPRGRLPSHQFRNDCLEIANGFQGFLEGTRQGFLVLCKKPSDCKNSLLQLGVQGKNFECLQLPIAVAAESLFTERV